MNNELDAIEKAAQDFVENFNYGLTTKEQFKKIFQSDAAKEYWYAKFKAEQVPEDFEEITGHKTHEEMAAYEKGREHEESVYMKSIKEWDGKTNSAFGQAMHDTFARIAEQKQSIGVWVDNEIIEITIGRMCYRGFLSDSITFEEAVEQIKAMLDETQSAITNEDIEKLAKKEYPIKLEGFDYHDGSHVNFDGNKRGRDGFIKGYKAAINNQNQ